MAPFGYDPADDPRDYRGVRGPAHPAFGDLRLRHEVLARPFILRCTGQLLRRRKGLRYKHHSGIPTHDLRTAGLPMGASGKVASFARERAVTARECIKQ